MRTIERPQFILLTHNTKVQPGGVGSAIFWECAGIFDDKDEAIKHLLNQIRQPLGFRVVRATLPTAFIENPELLDDINGQVTDLAVDEPEDRVYPEVEQCHIQKASAKNSP